MKNAFFFAFLISIRPTYEMQNQSSAMTSVIMTFVVGARFASYANYLKGKEDFEVKNNICFVVNKSDSLKRGSAQEKLNIKYRRIHLKCKFGNTAKSRSTGKR